MSILSPSDLPNLYRSSELYSTIETVSKRTRTPGTRQAISRKRTGMTARRPSSMMMAAPLRSLSPPRHILLPLSINSRRSNGRKLLLRHSSSQKLNHYHHRLKNWTDALSTRTTTTSMTEPATKRMGKSSTTRVTTVPIQTIGKRSQSPTKNVPNSIRPSSTVNVNVPRSVRDTSVGQTSYSQRTTTLSWRPTRKLGL